MQNNDKDIENAKKKPVIHIKRVTFGIEIVTLILLYIFLGISSSSAFADGADPRNKSYAESGGNTPCIFCHFKDWPSSVRSLEGATTVTTDARAWAIVSRRFPLVTFSG